MILTSPHVIHQLEITNFRALERFQMDGLGRVNLLVGTNNSGKTSVLEAIAMLWGRGSAGHFFGALSRRGELLSEDSQDREVDPSHLFHGHSLKVGDSFSIRALNSTEIFEMIVTVRAMSEVSAEVRRNAARHRMVLDLPQEELDAGVVVGKQPVVELVWQSLTPTMTKPRAASLTWPITRRGGISVERLFSEAITPSTAKDRPPVHFVTTEGLGRDRVVALFEEIVLTPEEDTVLSALKTLEPEMERLAPIGTTRTRPYFANETRGGLAVKIGKHRVPIGSMGDGIWRILGITLSLVRARGGILLIDEIDTGLHFSVLSDMWKLVLETSKRLNVQVFATTHSRDCYEALAAVLAMKGELSKIGGKASVSLQRIERRKPHAIAFSAVEIIRAAERGLEVR